MQSVLGSHQSLLGALYLFSRLHCLYNWVETPSFDEGDLNGSYHDSILLQMQAPSELNIYCLMLQPLSVMKDTSG